MSALIILAVIVLAAIIWSSLRPHRTRRRRSEAITRTLDSAKGDAAVAAHPQRVDLASIESVNRAVAERLWRLAFSAPADLQVLDVPQQHLRRNILAVLEVDELDANCFPRRPALLPQVLQAIDDPTVAAQRISRMIAHDPVLTADVLRMANSSAYRVSAVPVDSIQRAIVLCGIEALRGMLATAVLRPVFRASSRNFPRFPRALWDRTERAARAAELYILQAGRPERFEAQLAVLLNALGPLAIYGAALDVFARNPQHAPSPFLCVELIVAMSRRMSVRLAQDWQTPPRILAALQGEPSEILSASLVTGELLGTLAFLESQTVISADERQDYLAAAGISLDVWARCGTV